MLQFNPFIRLTVEQCLDHPYFDSIRDSEYSFESPVVLDFPFENIKQLSSQNIRAEMAKLVKKKKCRTWFIEKTIRYGLCKAAEATLKYQERMDHRGGLGKGGGKKQNPS